MRCDVLVFWDAMIFCNNFARWLQKIVACWCVGFLGCYDLFQQRCKMITKDSSMLMLMYWFSGSWFSGMLWSCVTTLQDDYKIVACRPRNPRIPNVRFDIQTALHAAVCNSPPLLERISISDIHLEISTGIRGWKLTNGDSFKKWGELPKAGFMPIWASYAGTKRRLDVKTSNRDSRISGSGHMLLLSFESSCKLVTKWSWHPSRRRLTPFLERIAISDNSSNCQPRIQVEILCSPSEDFGWQNKRLGTHFRSTFRMGWVSEDCGMHIKISAWHNIQSKQRIA
jgi:hypothetical protein